MLCVISFNLLLFHPSWVQILSTFCSQIPLVYVLTLMSEIKFHIHTKLRAFFSIFHIFEFLLRTLSSPSWQVSLWGLLNQVNVPERKARMKCPKSGRQISAEEPHYLLRHMYNSAYLSVPHIVVADNMHNSYISRSRLQIYVIAYQTLRSFVWPAVV
jgi:hypothetical protein